MGRGHTLFRALAIAAFLACYATILIGGNVIASDSGLGCPDWPTCNGQLIPAVHGAAAVEFSHRVAAFVLSVLVLALTIAGIAFERGRPTLIRLTYSALASVVLEAILGGVVVDSDLTVGIVLVHFAIATVLFALLLLIAILANVRELPPGWKAWARRAMDERTEPAAVPRTEREPAPVPASVTGPASPPA